MLVLTWMMLTTTCILTVYFTKWAIKYLLYQVYHYHNISWMLLLYNFPSIQFPSYPSCCSFLQQFFSIQSYLLHNIIPKFNNFSSVTIDTVWLKFPAERGAPLVRSTTSITIVEWSLLSRCISSIHHVLIWGFLPSCRENISHVYLLCIHWLFTSLCIPASTTVACCSSQRIDTCISCKGMKWQVVFLAINSTT